MCVDFTDLNKTYPKDSYPLPHINHLVDSTAGHKFNKFHGHFLKLQSNKDKNEARKLRIKAAKYVLIDEVLYKRGFSQPYLRCLAPNESNYVLREVYERARGNHSRARTLVYKVIRAGYY